MKGKRLLFCAISVACGTALWAADEQLAVSGDASFALDTSDEIASPIVVSSAAELAALRGVAYRIGETVTATAPNGTETVLVSDANATGAVAFSPASGGYWTLSNSSLETAKFLVAWAVNGDVDTAIVSSADYGAYWLDTVQAGPDRKLKKREVPPVAYSGDDWAAVATSATLPAATVTFTPPEGSGLEATTWDDLPGGNGARAFTFNARGVWTVTLTFADNTTRTALIDIQTAGFVLIVK